MKLLPISFSQVYKILLLDQKFHRVIHRVPQVEVPVIFSSEQRCFRVLTIFSAETGNIKNISADQLCFRADQFRFSLNQGCSEPKNSALVQRESALILGCSALVFLAAKHWAFSADQRLFSVGLLSNSSDIKICRLEIKL